MKRVQQLLCCYPAKDDDFGKARRRDSISRTRTTNGGKLLNPSSPAEPFSTVNEVVADTSPPAPIPSQSSSPSNKPAPSSDAPKADPKKRDKEGAGGWQVTVALVEKALGAAKLVLDNFSIPGAVPAVDGILTVITAVKVRVFVISTEVN